MSKRRFHERVELVSYDGERWHVLLDGKPTDMCVQPAQEGGFEIESVVAPECRYGEVYPDKPTALGVAIATLEHGVGRAS
jgi:hypothetical protein